MGIGFVIIIALLAGLLGMFARQALANIESDEAEHANTPGDEEPGDASHRATHVM